MSLQLNRSDRKILLVASAIFIALICTALLATSPENNRQTLPTTYSTDSHGAKAAYLLLQEVGYHVDRWEQSLSEFSAGKNTTLILAEPARMPDEKSVTALHHFIEQGGTVIATGPSSAPLLPAMPEIRRSPIERTWNVFPAIAPSAITRAAPQITIAPQAYWKSQAHAVALYGKEDETVVVQYSYGEGRVLWWASSTPLTNAGLKEPGNLEFFLASLGGTKEIHILFDEYLHGYGWTSTLVYEYTLAAGMLIQLAVFGLAVAWTFSRRSGPVRPSVSEDRLSPLEFVETLGGLYRYARASSIAVDICYQRFRHRLAKRLGISSNAASEEFERKLRERWNYYDEKFVVTLNECAATRHHPDISSDRALQLVRALHSYAADLNLYSTSVKENS